MTNRIKKTITIQTRSRTIVRGLGKQFMARCQQCGAEVSIVTPENAAGVLQATPRQIHGLLASGDLHAVEEQSGENLICGNSLSTATDSVPGAAATGSKSAPPAVTGQPLLFEGEKQ